MITHVGIHYGRDIKTELITLIPTVIPKPKIPDSIKTDHAAKLAIRNDSIQETIIDLQNILTSYRTRLAMDPTDEDLLEKISNVSASCAI
jgi:hypothetical protein